TISRSNQTNQPNQPIPGPFPGNGRNWSSRDVRTRPLISRLALQPIGTASPGWFSGRDTIHFAPGPNPARFALTRASCRPRLMAPTGHLSHDHVSHPGNRHHPSALRRKLYLPGLLRTSYSNPAGFFTPLLDGRLLSQSTALSTRRGSALA